MSDDSSFLFNQIHLIEAQRTQQEAFNKVLVDNYKKEKEAALKKRKEASISRLLSEYVPADAEVDVEGLEVQLRKLLSE